MSDDFPFGDPIWIRRTRKEKIVDSWNKYKWKLWVPVILATVSISVSLSAEYYILHPSTQTPPSQYFEANVTGKFDNSLELDLKYLVPNWIPDTITVEGNLPHQGSILVRIENFTLHKSAYYNPSLVGISKIEMSKEPEMRVGAGPLNQNFSFELYPTYNATYVYLAKNGELETHGPIGDMLFRIDYYDIETNQTKTFFADQLITGMVLG